VPGEEGSYPAATAGAGLLHLEAGRHIATVIVVHDPGRLYPEAINFTTTAP
jgi:hypothetical protein